MSVRGHPLGSPSRGRVEKRRELGHRGVRYTRPMAGIVFLRTAAFDAVREFYLTEAEMEIWLEQPGIAILRHGNMLIGFHRQPQADLDGLITFSYETREEVDEMYTRLRDVATGAPKENPKYRIYHFFATDPEGRKIEFQQFLHAVPGVPAIGPTHGA